MQFLNFLWNGIPPVDQLASYPEDEMLALCTTYEYDGKVTNDSINWKPSDDDFYPLLNYEKITDFRKIVIIDSAVRLEMVSDKIRDKARRNLNEMSQWGLLASGLGGIGSIFTGKRIYDQFGTGSSTQAINWFTLALLGTFTLCSLNRAKEANNEFDKWKNPIEKYCLLRREASQNFNKLQNHDLREKLFTREETTEIFYYTLEKCQAQFENSQRDGDPSNFANCLKRLIEKKCPLRRSSVHYANRTDMLEDLVDHFEKITNQYLEFKAGNRAKLEDIEDVQVIGGAIIGKYMLLKINLSKERYAALRLATTADEKKKIEEEYNSKENSLNLGGCLADTGLKIYSLKVDQNKRDERQEIIKKFAGPMSGIFKEWEEYHKSKFSLHRRYFD